MITKTDGAMTRLFHLNIIAASSLERVASLVGGDDLLVTAIRSYSKQCLAFAAGCKHELEQAGKKVNATTDADATDAIWFNATTPGGRSVSQILDAASDALSAMTEEYKALLGLGLPIYIERAVRRELGTLEQNATTLKIQSGIRS